MDFKEQHKNDDLRFRVFENTFSQTGSNDSAFIFFGAELKNIASSVEKWIAFLLKYFFNAEGRMFFQWEDDGSTNKVWSISKGQILEEKNIFFPFVGHGNIVKE